MNGETKMVRRGRGKPIPDKTNFTVKTISPLPPPRRFSGDQSFFASLFLSLFLPLLLRAILLVFPYPRERPIRSPFTIRGGSRPRSTRSIIECRRDSTRELLRVIAYSIHRGYRRDPRTSRIVHVSRPRRDRESHVALSPLVDSERGRDGRALRCRNGNGENLHCSR